MPGFAAILSLRPAPECAARVQAMMMAMRAEPFYQSGRCDFPALGLHAGWVALDQGLPVPPVFQNATGEITLILAGECFLDEDLASGLRQKGHQLGSHSATWLVPLYEEHGPAFTSLLNGLYSGLLVDQRARRVILFNDRFGFQRLYWHQTNDALYLASEAKALLRLLPECRRFDATGVAEFLAAGCPLGGRTLFQGIQTLPGASRWTYEAGAVRRETYFSAATWEALPPLTPAEYQRELNARFTRIMPRYYGGEAGVGIALTGGLDSRMILAARPRSGPVPRCFTYTAQAGETLDDEIAAQLARMCGWDHRFIRLGPDFFTDFSRHVDKAIYNTDGCFGVTGAHEIYFNRQVRDLAPVRLTGVFGSEVLRSISTFKPMGLAGGLASPELRPAIAAAARQLIASKKHPVTYAAFQEIPWNIQGSVTACRSQVHFRSPYLDNELVALAYQTPVELRGSGAPAFEFVKQADGNLGRLPTDMGYQGEPASLAGRWQGLTAKATFKLDYYANDGLPHWLAGLEPFLDQFYGRSRWLGRHKYLRYRRWFRGPLAGYVSEALSDAQGNAGGFFDPLMLKSMAGEHLSGRKNYQREINAVLMLRAVERLLLCPGAGAS